MKKVLLFSVCVLLLMSSCGTYAGSGLLLDQDVFFTYSNDDLTLDIRYLAAKLNSVVFGTMLNFNQ